MLGQCKTEKQPAESLKLWYDHPANSSVADLKEGWRNDPEWLKALPVGNGFLGAMVFGDVNLERLQLNEKSLWSGSPDDNNNHDDLRLRETYFQYGRYLLISSSREGSLPANLQGIRANKIQTPWNCDYHTDINVQLKYWQADAANLS